MTRRSVSSSGPARIGSRWADGRVAGDRNRSEVITARKGCPAVRLPLLRLPRVSRRSEEVAGEHASAAWMIAGSPSWAGSHAAVTGIGGISGAYSNSSGAPARNAVAQTSWPSASSWRRRAARRRSESVSSPRSCPLDEPKHEEALVPGAQYRDTPAVSRRDRRTWAMLTRPGACRQIAGTVPRHGAVCPTPRRGHRMIEVGRQTSALSSHQSTGTSPNARWQVHVRRA